MATKKNATATRPTVAPVTTLVANKSERIRDYAAAHPELKPAQIAKALTAEGLLVNSARVAGVLRGAMPKVDVEMIKSAAAFIKSYKGNIADAAADIESVGAFVERCGSKDKALAALVSFKELSEALG